MAFKKFYKVFLVLILIFVLIFLFVFAYLLLNARKILLSEIEKNLGMKTQASSLRVVFPTTIIVEDFALGDNIKVDKIVVSPSLLGFIRGDIVLNLLILEKPRLKITRNSDDSFDFGIPFKKTEKAAAAPGAPARKGEKAVPKAKRFYFNKLKVVDGNIDFIDKGVSADSPFIMKFSNLNLDVFRPSLLQLFRMQFQGRGDLVAVNGERIGRLDMAGWVDVFARDMDARASLTGVRLAYLEPYYKKFSKRDLKSGDMSLTGDFESKKNDLKVALHVELKNVAFQEKEETPSSPENAVANVTAPALLAFNSIFSTEGNAVFDFSIETKMDKPKFEHIKFKASFLQSRIEAALSKPPQETIEDFKKMGKEFEAVGKQFKAIFKSKE